ncbi:MAG: RnfABCDGE type electron transport complex subunit D [Gammaproteobacteria bacterium]|nr:RnfABCDGE type electron transport complex subunit D [Gammaproteobacteria bacterium]
MRAWGGYPDGIAFGVLIANAATPFLDALGRGRVQIR